MVAEPAHNYFANILAKPKWGRLKIEQSNSQTMAAVFILKF